MSVVVRSRSQTQPQQQESIFKQRSLTKRGPELVSGRLSEGTRERRRRVRHDSGWETEQRGCVRGKIPLVTKLADLIRFSYTTSLFMII